MKIWYIFHSTIKALLKLKSMSRGYFNSLIQQQAFQLNHGDIQPKTIHFTNDGEVRILLPMLINSLTGYEKMLHSSGILDISKKSKNSEDPQYYKTCLSPLLTEALKNGVTMPKHDPFASDVWSLGMTILSACSLRKFTEYYDYDQGLINYALMQKDYLKMLKLGYSEELVKTIESCLQETEERRAVLDDLNVYIDGLMSFKSGNRADKENNPLNANLRLNSKRLTPVIETDSILSGIQLKIKSDSKKDFEVEKCRNPIKAMRLGSNDPIRNVFNFTFRQTPSQVQEGPRIFKSKSKKRSLSLSGQRPNKASHETLEVKVSEFNPQRGRRTPKNLNLRSSSHKKKSRSIDQNSYKGKQSPILTYPASNLKSKWSKTQDIKPMLISNFMVKQSSNTYNNHRRGQRRHNPLFNFNFKKH